MAATVFMLKSCAPESRRLRHQPYAFVMTQAAEDFDFLEIVIEHEQAVRVVDGNAGKQGIITRAGLAAQAAQGHQQFTLGIENLDIIEVGVGHINIAFAIGGNRSGP